MTWTSESSRVPQEQQIRDSLIRSMDANGATPSRFLELLDAVTRDEIWRRLKDRHSRPFGLFTDFVMAERPEGLGLHGKEDLRKHLALQHKEEREPYRRQATVDRMAGMRQRVNGLLGEEVQKLLTVPAVARQTMNLKIVPLFLLDQQETTTTSSPGSSVTTRTRRSGSSRGKPQQTPQPGPGAGASHASSWQSPRP